MACVSSWLIKVLHVENIMPLTCEEDLSTGRNRFSSVEIEFLTSKSESPISENRSLTNENKFCNFAQNNVSYR